MFLDWANEKKKRKIENPLPKDLDDVLINFYIKLKKTDHSDYKPQFLGVIKVSKD